MTQGSDPTPYEIRPRWSFNIEENFVLATEQLRKQGAPSALVAQFCFDYGYLAGRENLSTKAYGVTAYLHDAATDNGINIHWVD